MGKLNIVKTINLTQYENNPDPKYVTPLLIGNEPKNDIWQYYIENNRAACKKAQVTNANYDSLVWAVSPQTLPIQQRVRRIGIKTFPQVGAIGFFTLLNEERTKILAPIHTQTKKYNAPTLKVADNVSTLSFTISDPKNKDNATTIKYICYRIILRLGDFAHEYITYEQSLEVPKPATTGTYDIYCVGYIHEGEAVSEDSNHISLAITGTQTAWPGPMEGADIFVTDIEITKENKVHIRRSDGFEKTSDTQVNFNGYATTEQLTEAIQAAIKDSWEASY